MEKSQTTIDYYKLVQTRKQMRENPIDNPFEEMNNWDFAPQIKKTKWLFMRTIFRLQEYFCEINAKEDLTIMISIMCLFLLKPSPEKFKAINHILNETNLNYMQNSLLDFYTKSQYFFRNNACNGLNTANLYAF